MLLRLVSIIAAMALINMAVAAQQQVDQTLCVPILDGHFTSTTY